MRSKEGRMKFIGWEILSGIGALAFAVLFAFLFGWVLMLLWNWLMPEIFGLAAISYIQAWGLILLSHLLFKGHGGNRASRPRARGARGSHLYGPGERPSREDMDSFRREFRSRMKHHWEENCPHEECCQEDNADGTDSQS